MAASAPDIFASDCPALLQRHLEQLIEGSGLLLDVIRERGYRSITGASGYTDLKTLGFSPAQARLTPGLLLPLHTTDGKQPLTVYRPDHPQPDAKGRLKKYLLPKGAGVTLLSWLLAWRPSVALALGWLVLRLWPNFRRA